jgi:uncharacterized protein
MVNRNWRRIEALWFAVVLGAAAMLPVPAGAQFFGRYDYRPSRPPPPPPPPQRGFFSFPFFGGPGSFSSPYDRPPPPPESFKAPPPRKYETPPTSTVAVVGDTMADWLAYGLEETLADSPDIGVVRNIRPTSGLIRYDAKNDTLDWPQSIKDALAAEKPSAIVVMLGLNDRLPFRDKNSAGQPDTAPQNGEQPAIMANEPQRQPGVTDFHTDKWSELYAKRIDDMIAALKSRGVPVLWVALPAIYGTRGTSDMSYLDELYRERAERAGIVYVDIWDLFVDEGGRFSTQGPDFEGQIRRLRTSDGVHFTKAGALKLAEYVAQDLRRVLANHVLPVALPAPEEAPKSGVAGPRPAVGPVLPLTVSTSSDGNNLLGDGGRTVPVNADPMAARVLTHGDPIAAPSGRADDFTWPRSGTDGTAEAEPEPAPPPAAPSAKGPPAKIDAKKVDDAKNKAKIAPNAPPSPAAARPAPRAELDGARRPPAAPGGGF